MTEPLLLALFGALGLLGAAAIAAIGTGFGFLWRRIADLEERVTKIAAARDRILWWAYDVKDTYYRHRQPGAPDLPPIPEPEEDTT